MRKKVKARLLPQLFQKFEQESVFQTLAAQASAALKSKELGSGKHSTDLYSIYKLDGKSRKSH